MPTQPFEIRRVGTTFFAEITGIDLSAPLDADDFGRVHDAHLAHGVLVFRDQHLTPEQHIAFSRRFGDTLVHSMTQFNLAEHPEILLVSNEKGPNGRALGIADAGRYWHTDMSYLKVPAAGSLLYARRVPDEGGDTMFADMTTAYADLPEPRRNEFAKLRAIHHFGSRWAREARAGLRPPQTKEEFDRNPPVDHPMVRTHPLTGIRALYAGGFTTGIVGMAQTESQSLLDEVEAWSTQPRYVHRHRWRAGDLVFWDNRRVMHHATAYPPDQARHMHRTTLQGTVPR